MVSKQAMEILLELASLVPEFCATSNPFEISERLIETDDYWYATPLYGYTNYSRVGFRSKILVYDDVPSFDGKASGSQLGGAGISVSSYTQRPEDSIAVARYLASAEVQNGPYTERHGQPGNLIAWLSPTMNRATNQFFRNTLRSIERSWVRPRMVGWPDFQFDLSQVIHRSLLRGSFAQTDWDDMLRIRDSLLEGGRNR
jgi:multiple sugar transport system substrate-binding protein